MIAHRYDDLGAEEFSPEKAEIFPKADDIYIGEKQGDKVDEVANIDNIIADRKKSSRFHKIKFFLIPIMVIVVYGQGFMAKDLFDHSEKYETVYYIVNNGDTLWDISYRYLGKSSKYLQIVHENRIKNPDLIYPGQYLKITIKQ